MSYSGLQNLVRIGRVTTTVVNICIKELVDSASTYKCVFIIYHYGGTYLNVLCQSIYSQPTPTLRTGEVWLAAKRSEQHTFRHYDL